MIIFGEDLRKCGFLWIKTQELEGFQGRDRYRAEHEKLFFNLGMPGSGTNSMSQQESQNGSRVANLVRDFASRASKLVFGENLGI